MQPRTGLCHVAKLQAISALWHPSPSTTGFYGSRGQSYSRYFLASMIGVFGI